MHRLALSILVSLAVVQPLWGDPADPARAAVRALRQAAVAGDAVALRTGFSETAGVRLAAAGWLAPAAADVRGAYVFGFELDRDRLPAGATVAQTAARVHAVLKRRLTEIGQSRRFEPQTAGHRVTIRLKDATLVTAARVRTLLGRPGTIELRLVAADEAAWRARPPQEGQPHPPAPAGHEWLPSDDPDAPGPRLVAIQPELTGAQFESIRSERHQRERVAVFELTVTGGQRMRAATRAHRGRAIAIVIDGRVKSAPVIHGEIHRQGVLAGVSAQEASELTACLAGGALPVPIRLVRVGSDRPLVAKLASLTRVGAVSHEKPGFSWVPVDGPDGLTGLRVRKDGARWVVTGWLTRGGTLDFERSPLPPRGR